MTNYPDCHYKVGNYCKYNGRIMCDNFIDNVCLRKDTKCMKMKKTMKRQKEIKINGVKVIVTIPEGMSIDDVPDELNSTHKT